MRLYSFFALLQRIVREKILKNMQNTANSQFYLIVLYFHLKLEECRLQKARQTWNFLKLPLK